MKQALVDNEKQSLNPDSPGSSHPTEAYRGVRHLLAFRGRTPSNLLSSNCWQSRPLDAGSDPVAIQIHECFPRIGSGKPIPDSKNYLCWCTSDRRSSVARTLVQD